MTITYDRTQGKVTFKCGDDFHYSQEGLPSDKDYGIRASLLESPQEVEMKVTKLW